MYDCYFRCKVDAKAVSDGIDFDIGYGAGGCTSQESLVGPLRKRDREVMQKTMMVGKAVVHGKTFCDNFRVPKEVPGEKRRRVSFPKKQWEEVMKAGFALYPIGKLVEAGTMNSRVVFSAPPTGPRRNTYSNVSCRFDFVIV